MALDCFIQITLITVDYPHVAKIICLSLLVSNLLVDFKRILKEGNKKAQVAAIENPEFYDVETEELYQWWESESKRRGFKVV